jgi:hypothetical protein
MWVSCIGGILPRSHAAPFDGWNAQDATSSGEGGVCVCESEVR